ncbi:DUF5367 family protein [Bacillus sp. S13(2024)]|uniref:DUF5367 family protein n=1 Tax=unclassified Bacillus (in: firmicutes) TaxID=185979 RepID=UPI003D1DE687
MNEKLSLTILFSVGIWMGATAFFFLFGKFVLVSITSSMFITRLIILEIATAVALYGIMLLYKRLDPSQYSTIKLGIFGTAIGLFLDTFIIYYSSHIFSALSSQQILSFVAWMLLAYVLYLLLPIWIERTSIKEK